MKRKNNSSPTTFDSSAIVDLASLAAKLVKPEHPVLQYIEGKLAPETRQLLAGYAANGLGAQVLSVALAKDFAGIIAAQSFYEQSLFDGINLSPMAQKCVGKHLKGPALSRLPPAARTGCKPGS